MVLLSAAKAAMDTVLLRVYIVLTYVVLLVWVVGAVKSCVALLRSDTINFRELFSRLLPSCPFGGCAAKSDAGQIDTIKARTKSMADDHRIRSARNAALYGVVAGVVSFAKSRVIEQHNRRAKRKLKSHPPPQQRRGAPFFAPGATSVFALGANRAAQ